MEAHYPDLREEAHYPELREEASEQEENLFGIKEEQENPFSLLEPW